MDAALNAFLITIAIVGGILSPIILIAFFGAVGSTMKGLTRAMEAKTEEIKRMPPFDDVELNLNPSTNVLQGRIIKNDAVLWQGSVTRNEKDTL
jgi:hypothetical protein